MKERLIPYGKKNICGAKIERLRKEKNMKQQELAARMQTMGVDISPSSLSKLEGQIRIASDIELFAISKILKVPMEALLDDSILARQE